MKTLKALFWGCVTGAALAYLFAPRRIDLLRAKYGMGAQSSTGSSPATGAPRSAPSATGSASAGERGATTTTTTDTARSSTLDTINSQTATADTAAFIGNMHTRVYHNAIDNNLPSEENRAYFATAEDAEAAGYRAAGQTTQV